MLFSSRDPDHGSHTIRIVRDIVEIVAILAAGFWAFYVFIYENRIKPLLADPQQNIVATMQKTSERGGTVGILLRTEVRNEGSVRFFFVGYAVTVLGTRMTPSNQPLPPSRSSSSETTDTFFRLSPPVAVYGDGFITQLGNPSSPHGGELQPGSSISQEHTFYIPAHRFDLLNARVIACFEKTEAPSPARFEYRPDGTTAVSCPNALRVAYDVGSLDLR